MFVSLNVAISVRCGLTKCKITANHGQSSPENYQSVVGDLEDLWNIEQEKLLVVQLPRENLAVVAVRVLESNLII